MKRELDSTISVTGFFILAALTALVFSGCGRNASTPDVNRGDSLRGCGYDFELEQNQSTIQGQLAILAGIWRNDHKAGYTTVRVSGQDLQQKDGIQFDFVKQVYGEILLRFSSVNPSLVLASATEPTIKYNALRISTPLAGIGDGTYRAIETYLSNREPSYNTCKTYLYKSIDGNNLVIAPLKNSFVVGANVKIPPVADAFKDVANPDSYKFVKQQ